MAIKVTVDAEDYCGDSEEPWCTILTASAANPTGAVGSATAYLIDRSKIEPDFFADEMWELSQTTDDFLKSGVWSHWDDEDIALVFHEVVVDRALRRQGIGKGLVNALFAEAVEQAGHPLSAVFVAPGYLGSEMDRAIAGRPLSEAEETEIRGQQIDVATSFWESVGFERVEGLDFFAVGFEVGGGGEEQGKGR